MGQKYDTFEEGFRLMNQTAPRHPCFFWSSDDELSHAKCSCGWNATLGGAANALDAWRAHLAEVA